MKTLPRALLLATAASLVWVQPANAETADGAAQAVQAELQAMRAEMQRMAQRVNTLESQLANAQAQAQEAKTTATSAVVAANAANEAAGAATAAAEKSGKSLDVAKWAADTKVSGRMYFNISSVSADNAAGANVEKDGGFQIKRFYVGVDHKFDDVFSGGVTMDIDSVANSSGKNIGKGFYVKKAFLEAKLDKALKLRLGATDMPWVPYAEGIYGYRHIEKTLIDLDGYGTSSDWGVHAMGDLADGLVSYQVSAVDGGGYRDPKFTKTVDIEGRLAVKYQGFNAAIGGYTGKLGNNVEGAVPYRRANRLNALLAYKASLGDMPVTLGGEYFRAKNWKVKLADPEDTAEGYSVFASVAPLDEWSVFGRYDWITPFQDTDPLKKSRFFQTGIQYSPAKIVDLALVYKRDNADDGLKIGNLGNGQETRDEIGLYGQFRF